MDPSALMMGGGSIGLQAVGMGMNHSAQQEANWQNKQMAKEQMHFQERMSNTAYQRQKADMLKAGINPALAISKGSGASTPGGASAQMQANTAVGDGLMSMSSSALEAAKMSQELKQQEANIQLTKMQVGAAEAQRELNSSSAMKNWEELRRKTEKFNKGVYRSEDDREVAENLSAITQAQLEKIRAETDKDFHKFDTINRKARTLLDTASSATDLIKPKVRINTTESTTENYDRYGEHTGTRTTRRTSK